MSGVTLGLLGLSAKLLFRVDLQGRAAQVLWAICGVGCAFAFSSIRPDFADVMVWALAAAAIWGVDRCEDKPRLLFACLAGVLVGAVAPFVALLATPYVPAPGALALGLVVMSATLCGTVLAGVSGAAMGVISALVGVGSLAPLALGGAVAAVAVAVAAVSQSRPSFGLAALLLIPIPMILISDPGVPLP